MHPPVVVAASPVLLIAKVVIFLVSVIIPGIRWLIHGSGLPSAISSTSLPNSVINNSRTGPNEES